MGLSQMPPGMMPPVGMMPQPPMPVDGGDFMAIQMPPGMPAMPSSARPAWPGTSVPTQGMGSGCSAPMVSSIPSDHSAQGPVFQHHSTAGSAFPHVPGRGEPWQHGRVSLAECSELCLCKMVLAMVSVRWLGSMQIHKYTCPLQYSQSITVSDPWAYDRRPAPVRTMGFLNSEYCLFTKSELPG